MSSWLHKTIIKKPINILHPNDEVVKPKYKVINPDIICKNINACFPVIDILDIVIISNINNGGSLKYINDILNIFNNRYN